MPTGHISTVNQDRLCLIASILDRTLINIGQIIETQIRHCAARTAGEMFFPSLITLMCQRVGITSPSHLQPPYTAGTITLVDFRRLLPVSETVSHPPPLASATPTSPSLTPSSAFEIASSSSTTTSSSVPEAANKLATETDNEASSSPIKVFDTERPTIPSIKTTAPTRRSNRPMSPPPPVAMPTPILPDNNTAPSVPPAPSTNARSSLVSPDQTIPPTPAPSPSKSAPPLLRNHLVEILRPLYDNQALFFDNVLARDQHLQTLLDQLFRCLFGLEPSPWPPAPAYQSAANPTFADHPPNA